MSEFIDSTDEKRYRILEAALEEFVDKGYKKASTNTIVREANVSKGLLFHYYTSKKELFMYLVEHAIKSITDEIEDHVNFADKDVLNRLEKATLQKIQSYNNHPLFMHLFEHVHQIKEKEIKQRSQKLFQKYSKHSYDLLFSNINFFLFRESFHIDRALDVMKWTIDRISQDWQAKHNYCYSEKAFKELQGQIQNYLGLFRSAFYK